MIKYIKYTFLAILFSVPTLIFAQKTEVLKYLKQIDSTKIRTTVFTLASDSLEGRGTGQRGNDIAQKYIVACLDSFGVKQGNGNSWFQNINAVKSFNVAKKKFIVDGDDFSNDYKYENLYNQDTILNISEIIFIAATKKSDSFRLNNIHNKVIMKLSDTPLEHYTDELPCTVINIFPDFRPLSTKVFERTYWPPSVPPTGKHPNKVNININLADQLLKSTGRTINEIIEKVEETGTPEILTLTTSAEIHGNVHYVDMNANNIIGIIEGSDLKDEYIILSAHYDHLGIVKGEIFNGADDNASGVSNVLEIARVTAKAKNEGNELRRSVVTLFFAAEESGLIGSGYYVNNPVFPLENTKACINVDMTGRIDDKYKSTNGNYIYVVNSDQTNGNLLSHVRNSNNDALIINTKDLNRLFKRSDHYNFAKNNIPSILLTSGLHNDYHTPKDDAELINFNALWKRNRFIFSLVWNLSL
ncbi:MAG: M28 family peptidase [Prevotellaceae bacterium]|jgi:hypothetical protein|nr:M28 family peptidase [Prevotellaceae bacterium]